MSNTSVNRWLELVRHAAWANNQLLNAAERLSPEQLRTPLGDGSFGDLLETLIHIYDADDTWFDRASTGSSGPALSPDDYPSIVALRPAFQQLAVKGEAYLMTLQDDALDERVSYRSYYGSEGTYTRSEMLSHQIMHAQQHRGEVALILSQLGQSPGEIDFLDYVEARNNPVQTAST